MLKIRSQLADVVMKNNKALILFLIFSAWVYVLYVWLEEYNGWKK